MNAFLENILNPGSMGTNGSFATYFNWPGFHPELLNYLPSHSS